MIRCGDRRAERQGRRQAHPRAGLPGGRASQSYDPVSGCQGNVHFEPERLIPSAQAESLGPGMKTVLSLKGSFAVVQADCKRPFQGRREWATFPRPPAWADRTDLSGRKRRADYRGNEADAVGDLD